MATNRTIQLKGKGRYEEARAAGAIKPGHLIKRTSADAVVVHATAKGAGGRYFALEDALQGKTVDGAYASGDVVPFTCAQPGDEIMARLSAGENIIIGDALESNGDGALQKFTDGVIIAEAREALDLSQTGDVEGFLAVIVRG